MIGGKWFSRPDDDRESWCFLVLRLASSGEGGETRVSGWQAGYGNPVKMVRILEGEGLDERETVKKLLGEMHSCWRRGVTLITLDEEALPALRTRALLLGLNGDGLRVCRRLCVKELLKGYFLGIELEGMADARTILKIIDAGTEAEGLQEAQVLWRLFSAIGPLLPEGCFCGRENRGVTS